MKFFLRPSVRKYSSNSRFPCKIAIRTKQRKFNEGFASSLYDSTIIPDIVKQSIGGLNLNWK